MRWQVLVNGDIKEEIEVTDEGWRMKMPREGITVVCSNDGGVRMIARSHNEVELRILPHNGTKREEYEYRNGEAVEIGVN